MQINLGTVPFLNAMPLVRALEKGGAGGFNVTRFEPSVLAEKLAGGAVDVGLVPSVELLRSDDLAAMPGISISSFGKVDSVVLVSKREITAVRTVSVDGGSRSSAALLRIVFELFLGTSPEYARRDPGNGFLDGVDAGMLIGDRGLRALHLGREGFPLAYDLGEIWTEETGLPFVYAVFAARKGARLGDVDRRLLEARDRGVEMVSEIAGAEAQRLGLRKEQCETYLGRRIRYGLGGPEIEGLSKYRELLARLGEMEGGGGVDFYSEPAEARKRPQGRREWKNER